MYHPEVGDLIYMCLDNAEDAFPHLHPPTLPVTVDRTGSHCTDRADNLKFVGIWRLTLGQRNRPRTSSLRAVQLFGHFSYFWDCFQPHDVCSLAPPVTPGGLASSDTLAMWLSQWRQATSCLYPWSPCLVYQRPRGPRVWPLAVTEQPA